MDLDAWPTLVVQRTTLVILAMKTIPKISETEWEIMRVIWAQQPLTAAEIVARLSATDPSWHPKTTRTLLTRLIEKRALGHEARGRSYLYRPLVTEAECVAAASGSFVDRVFSGALKPMLVHFIAQRRLTRKDLDELRALLDEPKDKSNRKGPQK